jgi:deoxyribodipyrimidine photo-lyase
MINTHHRLSLFIFRRDLRLEDNTGLIAALENSESVIPIFIFDPRQCRDNEYKSNALLQFMLESVEDLDRQLKSRGGRLFLYYGESERVIEDILSKNPIDAVYFNQDYTPFSKTRDAAITGLCKQRHIASYPCDDALIIPPGKGLKSDGTPYRIFTPFYRNAIQYSVAFPKTNSYRHYYVDELKIDAQHKTPFKILKNSTPTPLCPGGREACLQRLEALSELTDYDKNRNFPALSSTSLLSAHLKFTTCSVREIFHWIRERAAEPEGFIRELYWRDFFTHIAYHFPHVMGHAFHPKMDSIPWDNNEDHFKAWCQGETGFPIVDAGMRQLNETGFMHNRVRMITASFLIKDLHIDWRWGEKYFAQKLVDYDPAVNNGNWQWVAGTGTDAQPYYRIFNPWLQQKKFDPECVYIKTWLPECRDLSIHELHTWFQNTNGHLLTTYPKPMIDHAQEAARAKLLWGA